MVYDLGTSIDRDRFARRTASLMAKNAIVECSEHKKRRTNPQNRYLHAILGYFAMQTGYTLEYVKTMYFKKHCNRNLFVYFEFDKLLCKEVEKIRSSKDIDTSEMTIAIERFRNWSASEAGIDIPSHDDKEWISFIEREMQYQKIWL